ncbi:MAG: hypothetical protein IPP15_13475 [Saprospiraceae bacterium]|uniref:Trypsin-like peptidase domain-containing protein n=1 Tax=Candidatus Opimibacter skivensis TaxID=2982028 RepID=A0A9D7SWT7_9BACT|nr:hypothetical protein [Candidatus Opimibacter skivensis]
MLNIRRFILSTSFLLIGILATIPFTATAQKSSIVQVHADKSSGYGVACGGPDLIVTALHVVSGKSTIMVVWQGKSAYADIEKIYKPSDLALLRLQTPLGIPFTHTLLRRTTIRHQYKFLGNAGQHCKYERKNNCT